MEIRMGKSVRFESDKKDETTGSINPNIDSQVRFYPNPVYDFLTIYNPNPGSSLSIFDLSGHLLFEKLLQNGGEQTIDMKSMMPGFYIMNYKSKQLVKSNLILKK